MVKRKNSFGGVLGSAEKWTGENKSLVQKIINLKELVVNEDENA